VNWLPDKLPKTVHYEWTAKLPSEGPGGIAVSDGFVVLGSRDALDQRDIFQCFDNQHGDLLWQHTYPASGQLDYGNAPRATPLIHGDCVYTLGAFGQLCCVELDSGILLWQKNLAEEYQSPPMTWGHSGSPLIVQNRLIVQPGGKKGSLVALDPETGEEHWVAQGEPPSYSSFLHVQTGSTDQIVGFDQRSLGGWDVRDGRRLWKLIPPVSGDFNVPTPVLLNDQLLITSENNGTRLYHFHADGRLELQPDMENPDLKPDSHTPVVSGGRIYGICGQLQELDPQNELKTTAIITDDAFSGYGCLIASEQRLLALSENGELLLLTTEERPPRILSRLKLSESRTQILSHPAVVEFSLYLRIGNQLGKLSLKPPANPQ
jgi:outer membrane protein assembly factor BamB